MNTRYSPGRSLFRRLRDAASSCAVVAGFVASATAAIPNPTSIEAIPAIDPPGTATHNYPFLATNLIPPGSGYIEREFLWDPLESTCRHASLSIL